MSIVSDDLFLRPVWDWNYPTSDIRHPTSDI